MSSQENKVEFTAVLRAVDQEKFVEIFSASSRKARETYLHRHKVRASGPKTRLPKPGAKNEARMAALFELLKEKEDDEMAEEILRTWLLTKRPLLVAALDHLGIQHEDGLTESDEISKFEKLSKKDIQKLIKALEAIAAKEEILVYLRFMGTPNIDAV